jgi:hypothetical protein
MRRMTFALAGAVLAMLAVSALAATFSITRARWDAEDRKLSVRGSGTKDATITVTNTQTGLVLGRPRVDSEGQWRLTVEKPATVPCRVQAAQGSATLQRDVEGAPSSCAASATLSSLAVTGPATVTEGTTASYAATATFSNGSKQNVTASAVWSENSGFASIAGGVLTTTGVPSNQPVTVSASFTSGGVTRSGSLAATIQDVPAVTLSSLAVTGPATVTEGTTATYAATATYSNGNTQDVTASAAWSDDSGYTTITAGVLTAADVPSNQAVTVSASFTSGSVTRTGSLAVSVQDVPPPPPPVTGSHAGRFTTYEGTATCLKCHRNEAEAFHQSTHYQWQGDAGESSGLNTGPAGKLGGINDFCIYPDINWLGKLTTVTGKIVDGGCARCHTGKGLMPTPESTQAQLENIDCLLCHSPSYKRTLQELANGDYTFVADTANMAVSLLQAAVDIRRPGTDTCLNCHTKAGGGNNFKRGDIEEAHRPATATVSLDVHMASRDAGGAGLTCISCHTTVGHHIAGRGVDMRQRDLPNTPVQCTNCHPAAPHGDSYLNRHTARLECNVCHVPMFAKVAPTDMRRDWSLRGELNGATGLYEPHMVLQTNVTPVYRFFNGRSQFYQFGTPAVPAADGRVLMAGPLGSINEAGSKITAMKRHEGRQPVDPVTGWLIPLKIGIFFQKNDIATAIMQGVAEMGWTANGHAFAETERFMGVYHEVAPKEQALACSNCHGGTRMDFAALGYTPLTTRNGKPLCSSCHSAKTASFSKIHEKHVTDKGYDCSTCHTFTKAL